MTRDVIFHEDIFPFVHNNSHTFFTQPVSNSDISSDFQFPPSIHSHIDNIASPTLSTPIYAPIPHVFAPISPILEPSLHVSVSNPIDCPGKSSKSHKLPTYLQDYVHPYTPSCQFVVCATTLTSLCVSPTPSFIQTICCHVSIPSLPLAESKT